MTSQTIAINIIFAFVMVMFAYYLYSNTKELNEYLRKRKSQEKGAKVNKDDR